MAALDKGQVLDDVKTNLGISDNIQDDLLELLIDNVISHFKLAYRVDEVASRFGFVIEDCVIKRFNRRGAEGASKEDVDGHSMTFESHKNEFEPYDELLKREFQTGRSRSGGIYLL